MKHVLLISSNSSGRGGGEDYLLHLATGLFENNCKVSVLLSNKPYMDSYSSRLSALGCTIYRGNYKSLSERFFRFISSFFDFYQISLIVKKINYINPQLIIVNQQYDEDGIDILLAAKLSNINNFVSIMHMPMTRYKNKKKFGYIRGKLLSIFYGILNHSIIFVSKGAAREFVDYYPGLRLNSKYVVSGLPILCYKTNHIADIPNISGTVLGFIGQFNDQKNLFVLVDIWAQLRKNGKDVFLLLVGDGILRASLELRLKSIGCSHYFITGWVDNPERFIPHIDLYVMPSLYEGMPLSLLQVAGFGIPMVTSPFNGASDLEERANWLRLSQSHRAKDMYDEVLLALDSIEILKKYGLDGRSRFVEYFSTKRMAFEILSMDKK